MSQPSEDDGDKGADRTAPVAPEHDAANTDPDPDTDDVQGHAYTGALQDKNQQP